MIFILYFGGVLSGFALAALSAWADLEANFYGFSRQAKTPFHGLSCPALMGRDETREVVVTYVNRSDRPLKPNVRVELSARGPALASLSFAELAPGETLRLSRSVGPQNIDLERFIFVRALIYSVYPLTDEETTCGVFVLPFNGNGTAILTAWLAFSLILSGLSARLLACSALPRRKAAPFFFLALLLIPTLIFSLLGWWIQTILALAVSSLTLVVGLGGLAH